MDPKNNSPEGRMLPVRQVCARYGICHRTVDRWLDRGILPSPMRINRYRYWRESDLLQFERARMSTRKPNIS